MYLVKNYVNNIKDSYFSPDTHLRKKNYWENKHVLIPQIIALYNFYKSEIYNVILNLTFWDISMALACRPVTMI
ncbi:hypothetical protein CW304_27835 [Bacillus sp. UFRGS-B20]|nr:hypothetical protein CW304_27835 [Bacillus sp. UFRGS-B20]